MRTRVLFIALLAVVAIVGCGGTPIGVTIDDRYWEWDKEYTYQKITASIGPNNKPSTSQKTVVRCAGNSIGWGLPESAPQMPCAKEADDKENDKIYYYISYHEWESKTQRMAKIQRGDWDTFYPGASLQITVGFGHARVFVEVK